MRRRSGFAWFMALVIAACGSTDAPSADERSRVPPDATSTSPADVAAVDLDDLGPGRGLTFCEAFAATRTDWVDGAIVPLQWWIDAYEDVDEPARATKPLDALRAFADRKLAWNLRRVDARPVYDEPIARQAAALADAAASECPDLPLVVGLGRRGEAPARWADETESSIDRMCAELAREVTDAIVAYVARNGRAPAHAAQLEADSFVAWAYDDGELFLAPDFFGVRSGSAGAEVVPVPGGACDRP